jgi:hypothetical protein
MALFDMRMVIKIADENMFDLLQLLEIARYKRRDIIV